MWPFSSHRVRSVHPRHVPFATRVKQFMRLTLWLACACALTVVAYFSARHINRFLHSAFFEIQLPPRIVGASDALQADALTTLNLYVKACEGNLFFLDAKRLTRALVNLPRARDARVRKIYPNTLQLEFTERRPLLIANLDRPCLVDDEGVLLDAVHPADIRALRLPILTGLRGETYKPGDRIEQPGLSDVLQAAEFIQTSDSLLQSKIVEWNLNGRNEITAILRSRAEVRFGDRPPLAVLDKLCAALLRKSDIEKATYIDLRMERQIVYK